MSTELIGQRPTFTALPNWLRGKATPLEGWILWCLQSHYPNIHPSLTLLAQEACISRRAVCNVLSGLERKGWIAREQLVSESGRKAPTRYSLTIWDPHWAVSDSASGALVQEMHHQPSASGALTLVHDVHYPSAPGALKEEQDKKNKKKKTKNQEPPLAPPGGEHEQQDTSGPCQDLDEAPSSPHPSLEAETHGEAPRIASDAPEGVQPQPTQPTPPWGPTEPSRPLPAHKAESAPALAPVENPEPVEKPARKRASAERFNPTSADIPATLLPVAAELLAFWASKGGKRTQRAFVAQLRELHEIQDDPAGGTETCRSQLLTGSRAATFGKPWMAVTYDNWKRFDKPTPIMSNGFIRRPTTMDNIAGAIALIRQREAAKAAKTSSQSNLSLAGISQ